MISFCGTGVNNEFDGACNIAEFHRPEGIGFDALGNAYINDYYGNTIRKMTIGPSPSVITIAGSSSATGNTDGPGISASFNYPSLFLPNK